MYRLDERTIDENMTEGGRFRLRRMHLLTWFGVAIALFLAGVALGVG